MGNAVDVDQGDFALSLAALENVVSTEIVVQIVACTVAAFGF